MYGSPMFDALWFEVIQVGVGGWVGGAVLVLVLLVLPGWLGPCYVCMAHWVWALLT